MDNNTPIPTVFTTNNTPSSIPPYSPPNAGFKFNKLLLLISVIVIIVLASSGGFYLGKNSNNIITTPSPTNSQQQGCTLEAKICPDGSSVGRSGPNCEFAPCPTVQPTTIPTQIIISPTIIPSKIAPTANPNLNKNCISNKNCPENTFCDYNTPGWMTSNGFQSGSPYGSQKCITKCQNNDECPSGECQYYNIVGGDIVNTQKGCKPI